MRYCEITRAVSSASSRRDGTQWKGRDWSSKALPRTRKKGLDGSYYKRVLLGDVIVEFFVLKELELTGGEMLRRKAMRDRGTRADVGKQTASRSTAVCSERTTGSKRDSAGSSGSGSEASSFNELERKCNRPS